MKQITAALITALAILSAPASAQEPISQMPLVAFEFLGCSGDLEGATKPEVWRLTADGQVSFLTHTAAACGLSGREPSVTGGPESLDLTYEFYSESGAVVMCDCEYWAKFTFGPEAHKVKSVTIGGEQAVLRGSWPGR